MIEALLQALGTNAGPVAAELMQWVGSVQRNAVTKWGAVLLAAIPCACFRRAPGGGTVVIRCPKRSIAKCAFCLDPVCLEHACLAANADVACVRCMDAFGKMTAEARTRGEPPPWASVDAAAGSAGYGRRAPEASRSPFDGQGPNPEPVGANGHVSPSDQERIRREHLKTLGLEPGADDDELRRAFKKASAKHHPDRARSPAAQAKAETAFKKASGAFAWLKEHGTGERRAA